MNIKSLKVAAALLFLFFSSIAMAVNPLKVLIELCLRRDKLTTVTKIVFSGLQPHLIKEYGFYQGQGTPYRLGPQEIVEFFPHLKSSLQ